MTDSTDAGARRPVILYIIIAIVLFVALLVGVRWAKIRSNDYARNTSQTAQNQGSQPQGAQGSTQQPASQAPEQSPAQNNESTSTPTQPSASQSSPAASSRVPATGPEQVFLPIISISAVVFAGFSYVRARKRLQNNALSA